MDFIQMTQGAEGSVTFSINWDALTTFAQSLSVGQWWLLALGISVAYGIITHFRSLVQISRWNKRMTVRHETRVAEWRREYPNREPHYSQGDREAMEKKLEDWNLVPMVLYRLFLNLPVRILTSALGSVGMLLLFGASGKVRLNPLLRWGLGWTLAPHRLRSIANDGPAALGEKDWYDERYA